MNDIPLITTHPSQRTSHSRKVFANLARGSNAFTRHQQLISNYLYYYGGSIPEPRRARTERDILEENHKFLREDSDVVESDYEKKLSKNYYDQLFKEFALCDLSKWKEGQLALRWRIQSEVVEGKGQFICGSLNCNRQDHLSSYEVNFAYIEDDTKKNVLVKVRLCRKCAKKLGKGKKVKDKLDVEEKYSHSLQPQDTAQGDKHNQISEEKGKKRSQSPYSRSNTSPSQKRRSRSRDRKRFHE
ncbi:Protein FRA10AC1 [Neolecta irregularis DAH-3]|uniref:Protein FRA10AC1 n=1 Tax=Neolecta irregularis (strain DAH-3) TaxID=1198029 RepID=A0A1U7LTK7_NEOID|nr:Protein FRA10AC1 [Neolecta irregularis DAH-3]|eukprot:OLL25948.1 Protein FRA10AC1 [Neolecta irregularis DAH-3]